MDGQKEVNTFGKDQDFSHQNEFQDTRQKHIRRLTNLLSDLPEIIKTAESELDKYLENEKIMKDLNKIKEENQILRKKVEELEQRNQCIEQEKNKNKQEFLNYKSTVENNYSDEKIRLLQQIRDQKRELSVLRDLKDKVQSKSTDNTYDIADLSDKNRPTKIAEQYEELFDNEWTDAFEVVNKTVHEEAITVSILLETLLDIMDYCRTKAVEQMNGLREFMFMSKDKQQLSRIMESRLKESIKELVSESGTALYQKYSIELKELPSRKSEMALKIPSYVQKCVELCWLMAAQDPPVVLAPLSRPCDPFDTNHYKAYTKTGANVDYVVWPALLLHKDGPVLSKGVAQGYGETKGVAQGYGEIKRTQSAPPKDRKREQNANFSGSERAKQTKDASVAEERQSRTRRPLEYHRETGNTIKRSEYTQKNLNQDNYRYERRQDTTNKTAEIPHDFELEIYFKNGEQSARAILGDRYDVCVAYLYSL